ncbi:MAG: hypothetical protein WHW07_03380 [Bacteroidales bacterium]|jgi:hypothetical protein|nr:hypothetical protein [Bacteroidales bacterium]HOL97898.1 hypothetical protein [Bacteroidales bacterium]HOM35642.1 hypothetical protein [Bacteroidales bacterium]HPD22797.1 hypothetical protein [Bacteroidales bacterium]HRS98940.1 hypothetical protein [Bacteroidales bacterium]
MKKLLIIVFLPFLIIKPVFSSHIIFLVHGYANPNLILLRINIKLRQNNFTTINYQYPGLFVDLERLGESLYYDVKNTQTDTVSFVTHSMGALVLRSMMKFAASDFTFPVIHRIVMITPPNRGADIADFLGFTFLKPFLGPNVIKMKTDTLSYANKLPIPINTEIGVIIGQRGDGKGYNPLIKGDNDGLIRPENKLLGNEKDVLTVQHNHFTVLIVDDVLNSIINFLKYGKFNPY